MKRSDWISILALIISIIACIITWLRIEVYTTNDTFVGVIAGFIGACATILVGTQIYNSIDTKNTINKLNETLNNKIKEQNSNYVSRMRDIKVLNNELKYELNQIKKELELAKKERALSEERLKISIAKARAIAFSSIQPFSSYANYFISLKSCLEIGDHKEVAGILKNMKITTKIIERKLNKNESIATTLIEKCKKLDYNSLKNYPLSSLIEHEYTECHNKLLELIKMIQTKTN